ncbi:MAG TPA: peptidoglycan DD-metalloendopeptidase family protein [Patescibacteria group bacterium]|nr:peptidoglycan DD-metalloendopeptidase family protein [Patescibacteria group bacterium]
MLVSKTKEKPELRKFLVYIAAAFLIANAIFVADRIFAQQAADNSTAATTDDIGKINEEITSKKSKIDELQKDLDVYKQAIAAKRLEALTLKNHIAILDDQVHELEVGIEKAQEEIDATNLEIENLKLEIRLQEDKIAEHKQTLEELLRTLYRSDQKTLLDILLENHSFSEYYNQSQYLVSLNGELTKTVQTIEDLKTSLGEKKDELVVKKTDLTNLQVDLSTKKDTLVAQKESRADVLAETQNDEGKFQQLVEDVKSEQDQVNSEIANLSESVRKRLEQEKQKEGMTTEELAAKAGTGVLDWPIESRRITTVFHDPDYVYRRYFEHPGLDIGTPQGTAITASDGGVVAIAKKLDWVKNSNGKIIYPAYNFILIVHDNGLSTVYGHLSGVNVSEGEIVTKGQVIGRTGGLPGTAGAGRLTTGPHLHYEVRLNGIPVNPKEYLP